MLVGEISILNTHTTALLPEKSPVPLVEVDVAEEVHEDLPELIHYGRNIRGTTEDCCI